MLDLCLSAVLVQDKHKKNKVQYKTKESKKDWRVITEKSDEQVDDFHIS